MPLIRLETPIAAPPERCFDLARDVDLHVQSTARTGERAVAGVTSGLIGPGQSVTWEAVHLGLRQRLTSRITRFEPPTCSRTRWYAAPSAPSPTPTSSARPTAARS